MNNLKTSPVPIDATAPPSRRRPVVMGWAIGTGVALGLVSIAYLILQGLGRILVVAGPTGAPTEVTFGNVVGMTVLGGSLGAAMAYALGRWAPRPRVTFLTLCVVGLSGYAAVPFMASETVSTAIWLNVLHVAVAIPVVGFLFHGLPRTRSRDDT